MVDEEKVKEELKKLGEYEGFGDFKNINELVKLFITGKLIEPMSVDEIESEINSFVLKHNFSFKDIPVRIIAELLSGKIGGGK